MAFIFIINSIVSVGIFTATAEDALGGWYDTLGIENGKNFVASKATGTGNYSIGTVYPISIEWNMSTGSIKTSIKNGNKLIVEGTRSSDTKYSVDYTSFWNFRCEDGAVELSNFSFTGENVNESNPAFSIMTADGKWAVESKELAADKPVLRNGVLPLVSNQSVMFNWYSINGIGEYYTENDT